MKAVLFDMDGTFLDSLKVYKEAETVHCMQHGIELDEKDAERFIWCSNAVAFAYLIERYDIPDRTVGQLVDEHMGIFEKIAHERLRLYEGFEELAGWLKQEHKLAVVTSSGRRMQEFAFKKFSLDRFFDTVITGDMVERRKPDPLPYQVCLERLGIDPLDAIVLEDSPGGIMSAMNAGITTLAVGHTFSKKELDFSSFYVKNLREAKKWFEKYLKS
ncbi:HAD family phosphatase [Candidatus Woesearchaeota archaeon]|nr:HAD family phosphatase [Candidatus Woesearchaeota archaeon]